MKVLERNQECSGFRTDSGPTQDCLVIQRACRSVGGSIGVSRSNPKP